MDKIDRVIFINFEQRVDRKIDVMYELSRIGLSNKSERFPAILHERGGIGCSYSHIAVLKLIRDRGYDNVLILEDDFQFIVDKEHLDSILSKFFESYGETYDALMLSYRNIDSFPTDEIVGRCVRTVTASGYLVNRRILNELIDVLEKGTMAYVNTGDATRFANDICWFDLQATSNWYYLRHAVGIQRSGFSDIEKRFVDYKC